MVKSPHGLGKVSELAPIPLCSKKPGIEALKGEISSGVTGKSNIITLKLIQYFKIIP